jgi:hypothetical protein
MARLADLPESTMAEAKRVALKLADLESRQKAESQANKIAIRRKTLLRVMPFFLLQFCLFYFDVLVPFTARCHAAASDSVDPSTGLLCAPGDGTQSLSRSNTERSHNGLEGDSLTCIELVPLLKNMPAVLLL